MQTFRTAIVIGILGLVQAGTASAQTTQDALRAALKHRFETLTPEIGELLPDVELYDADGNKIRLREVAGSEGYTVIVLGCLTCPPFRKNTIPMETLERDFSRKGVNFYYIFKALAHPELNGYVEPATLEERLMLVEEAKRTLGSRIPWLCDGMDDAVLNAFGTLPNVEVIVDSEARLVRRRQWSDPQALRKDLEELVGPVENPTRVEDLNMQHLPPPPTVAKGIVPRVTLPGRMWPLEVEPLVDESKMPFFVKLRADGDPGLIDDGRGTLHIGFHLDPLYKVHWNNEAPPLEFRIEAPEDVVVTPVSGTGPTVEEPADADPREFLLDVVADRMDEPLKLSVRYFACDDALTFCIPVKQSYRISLQRDVNTGWAMRRWTGSGPNVVERNPIARFDTDGDSLISQDEAPDRMKERFSDIDTNGDGHIDADEIKVMAERQGISL